MYLYFIGSSIEYFGKNILLLCFVFTLQRLENHYISENEISFTQIFEHKYKN